MASKSFTLQIRPRGKPIRSLPETLLLDQNATGADLHVELAKKSNFSIHRLRVTKGTDGTPIPNAKDTTAHSTGLRDQSTVYVKDLGPQISWRTVFIIEYLGPILIHPLIYAARPYIYPNAAAEPSQMQTAVCLLVTLHFIKRELETMFVHRFSAATMPVRNIFKNSGHYWILSGLLMAAWVYSPWSQAAKELNPILFYVGLALYIFGEFFNLQVHLTLRGLRSSGGTERGIPQGWLFDLVTCPNYFTETLSWIGVWLVSGLNLSVLLFAAVSIGQMYAWSKKKESRYRKEFPDKYKKKRFTMFPLLL